MVWKPIRGPVCVPLDIEETSIRHSKFVANRFAHEAAPALENFANSSPAPFMAGIKASRERIVARKDEDRESFLRKQGFSRPETAKIIATVLDEEGRPPESIFDFVQGITALGQVENPPGRKTRAGGQGVEAAGRPCADPERRGGGFPSLRSTRLSVSGCRMRVREP